jgi:opacity protein-like surface antigen
MRLALLAGAILFPALAFAQSLEVFVVTGVLQLWDDEGNLGVGVPIGGGVGLRWPRGWGIEFLAETQKAKRDFDSGVRFDSTVTGGRARIIKYFAAGATQLYAGGGLGVTRVETTREAPSGCSLVNNVFTCTGRDIFQSDSTDGTWSGFAGVRIPAGSVLFVRPEFEISMAGEHMRMGGLVAVGASW